MYIAIWCTYRTLFFNIVSTIVEALVIALHQFLYAACNAKHMVTASSETLSLSDTISWRSDWNLRKMQGKWRNCESSVLSTLLFNCTHQILIHHRRSAAPQIIMHIFGFFIKQSHPSPYHWTTHGVFFIGVTKLMTNFSQFFVLRIQETDYRPHFTCGGIICFLKHYKHTAWCVYTVWMSANCVCALPQNQQTRHTWAPSWLQRCCGIFSNGTYFLDNLRITMCLLWRKYLVLPFWLLWGRHRHWMLQQECSPLRSKW